MLRNRIEKLTPLCIGAALLASCGPSGGGQASPQEPAKVRVIDVGKFVFQGCYYAAEEQGYFNDEKINNDTVSISADTATRALISGQADIGIINLDYISAADTNPSTLPRIIAGQANSPLFTIIAHKDVNAWADLRGKTIALGPELSSTTLVAEHALNKTIGKGAWKPTYVGGGTSGRIAALNAGEAQAALASPPIDLQATSGGKYWIVGNVADIVPRFTSAAVTASPQWLKTNGDTATRWVRAYQRGCKWLYEPSNKQAVIELFTKRLEISQKLSKEMYDRYLNSSTKYDSPSRDGQPNREGLELFIKLLEEGAS